MWDRNSIKSWYTLNMRTNGFIVLMLVFFCADELFYEIAKDSLKTEADQARRKGIISVILVHYYSSLLSGQFSCLHEESYFLPFLPHCEFCYNGNTTKPLQNRQ